MLVVQVSSIRMTCTFDPVLPPVHLKTGTIVCLWRILTFFFLELEPNFSLHIFLIF